MEYLDDKLSEPILSGETYVVGGMTNTEVKKALPDLPTNKRMIEMASHPRAVSMKARYHKEWHDFLREVFIYGQSEKIMLVNEATLEIYHDLVISDIPEEGKLSRVMSVFGLLTVIVTEDADDGIVYVFDNQHGDVSADPALHGRVKISK